MKNRVAKVYIPEEEINEERARGVDYKPEEDIGEAWIARRPSKHQGKAGDPGFKSQRARQFLGSSPLIMTYTI
ncbi:hypothetical protein CW706_02415 [Candidatus Bathyarchaeota archaeon]|nr:MAG: hypothetical protein CW706_02415 [Candidatus Bathyarchaeota archaeon]